jgi:hypothetical protein
VSETHVILDCPLPLWAILGIVVPLAVAILATIVVFLLIDGAKIPRGILVLIIIMLVPAYIMLVALALNPTIIRTWPDDNKPRCVVLADASRSMSLDDAYPPDLQAWLAKRLPAADTAGPKIKREAVERAVLGGGPESWITAISGDFDVVGWRFAGKGENLAVGEGAAPLEVDPLGYTTALGEVLDAATSGAGTTRPRAVVLLSDGAWNIGRDPTEVAKRLGLQHIPVFVVGLGDPDPPKDVAVLDVRGPKSSLLGDEIVVSARVAASGLGAVRVPVDLVVAGRTIETKNVATLPSGQPVTVNFTYVPDSPGRMNFEVRAARQEGEVNDTNNSASLSADVVERKINVLLADAESRWEFRFIRNVLERDPSVNLTMFLLRPGVEGGPLVGDRYLPKLPTDKKDLAAYDLIILGDLPVDTMPEAFQTEVADMVRRRGGALVVIAGRKENYRRLIGTPLAQVLPVKLEGAIAPDPRVTEPFGLELTQDGMTHLVTRLADSVDENESVWTHLPRVKWSASVGGLAPGATALVVHPYRIVGTAKMPVLAVHRVGDGKVMFSGLDETWRWRREVGDEFHYRFWAQAIRWMVKKQFTEGDPRARLSMDRLECNVGETAQIEAFCLGTDGFPLQDATVSLRVTDSTGAVQRVAMQPAPGGWGVYRASFTPVVPGKYSIQPIVSTYGETPLPSTVTLEALRMDLEKDQLAQNASALSSIAEASGGRYLKLTEVNDLPSLLAARKETKILSQEFSIWRNWFYCTLYFAILVGLLGAAWFLRKRSGLA